jgi:16S rRNA (guanine1207-N2)-methyltransferase
MDWHDTELTYTETRTLDATLGDRSLRIITRPGFPDWDQVSQAEQLLVAYATISAEQQVLVYPCGHGALGLWAAGHTDPRRIALRDTNAIAAEMARRTCAENDLSAIDVQAAMPEPESVDIALMTLPKGRDLARLMLLAAARAVRRGGQLYLAGANRAGIKSVANDADELLGAGRLLAYKGGNRVLRYTREADLSTERLPESFGAPGIPAGTYREVEIAIADSRRPDATATYRLSTRPGVFSWEHLDPGTALLLSVVHARNDEQLLDVGCGYGLIGIHLGLQAQRGRATLVDVDLLACECAQRNVGRYGPPHAQVWHGDGLERLREGPYSLIISNPPFHSGQGINIDMTKALIHQAHDALERNGRLVLVANRFLAYDVAMAERFGNVATLAETPQFYVLEAHKRHQRGSRRRSRRQ